MCVCDWSSLFPSGGGHLSDSYLRRPHFQQCSWNLNWFLIQKISLLIPLILIVWVIVYLPNWFCIRYSSFLSLAFCHFSTLKALMERKRGEQWNLKGEKLWPWGTAGVSAVTALLHNLGLLPLCCMRSELVVAVGLLNFKWKSLTSPCMLLPGILNSAALAGKGRIL